MESSTQVTQLSAIKQLLELLGADYPEEGAEAFYEFIETLDSGENPYNALEKAKETGKTMHAFHEHRNLVNAISVKIKAAIDFDEEYTNIFQDVDRQFKKQLVAQIMEHHRGNQTKCAQSLGISRVTFRKYLREYGYLRDKEV